MYCVWRAVKPKPFRIKLVKLPKAAFGICAAILMKNKIYVFGSFVNCQNWYHLKWWFLTPCLFAATLSTATTFSCWLRKRAEDGRLGIYRVKMTAQTREIAPNMRKTYCHCASPVSICPIAKPSRPPKIPATPFMQ